MNERIGLFGGTFNPLHRGHLRLARAAVRQLDLDRLLLVPSSAPPHKSDKDLAPGADRLAMCRAAVEGDPRIEASAVELRRGGPSYTVDTLGEIRRRHPDAELVLLVGADMLRDFHKWRRFEEIASQVRLATFPRPGVEIGRLPELRRSLGDKRVETILGHVLDTPLEDVSSTEIRERRARGAPVDDLVPEPVARYIHEHNLYR